MPVSKYRAAADDDVVTGNFWDLPLPVVVLAVWGFAAVTAAARMNANIKRGNRIGLSGDIGAQFAFRPQRDGGNQVRVTLLIPECFGLLGRLLSMAARFLDSPAGGSWAISRHRNQFSCSVSVT